MEGDVGTRPAEGDPKRVTRGEDFRFVSLRVEGVRECQRVGLDTARLIGVVGEDVSDSHVNELFGAIIGGLVIATLGG